MYLNGGQNLRTSKITTWRKNCLSLYSPSEKLLGNTEHLLFGVISTFLLGHARNILRIFSHLPLQKPHLHQGNKIHRNVTTEFWNIHILRYKKNQSKQQKNEWLFKNIYPNITGSFTQEWISFIWKI